MSHDAHVFLTSLMTCKLIGVTQGQWESASALDLHLWLNLTRILGWVLLSISLVYPSRLSWAASTAGEKNNHPTIDFLFQHHLRLFSFLIRQDPNDFHSLSPPLPSPSPSVSTSPSSCRTSSSPFLWLSLLFLSLTHSFFFLLNWNSSLWNGKVIYIDS